MPLERRVSWLVRVFTRADRRSSGASIATRRRQAAAVSRRGAGLVIPAGPVPAEQVDLDVPVRDGRIRVRIYRPHGSGPFPLYLFIHGGGWCTGTVEERDGRCRAIAAGARCVVASVDYRLAPENAFPTPVEDCYSALEWLVDHADRLDLDAARVAVGGESAGGNLAAALCLMSRDRGGPSIVYQWLDVPALDLTLSQPSFRDVPDGYLLDRAAIEEFLDCYLADRTMATDPYASPLLAPDLSGLPPAWIMSAEFDKLRDDGRAYAAALEAAGVPATYRILSGHVHLTFAFTRLLPSAADYERAAIAALARGFER